MSAPKECAGYFNGCDCDSCKNADQRRDSAYKARVGEPIRGQGKIEVDPWQMEVGEAACKAMAEAGFVSRGFRWGSAGKGRTRFTIVGERGAR